MRYIDADAFIEKYAVCGYIDEMSVAKFNMLTPTKNVRPVEYINWNYVCGESYPVYKCSNCGKYQAHYSNFCEKCGGVYIGKETENGDYE